MTPAPITVPLNDLRRYAAETRGRLSSIASEVLSSGHFVLGPSVSAFEREFATYCGRTHAIGVANGTDALELALRATGVASGQTVIVAANAAMYGATAVLATGATPRFADVGDSMLLTAATIAAELDQSQDLPAAVIVTHLYGLLADMPAIVALCRDRGISVVEDCAQAHGAKHHSGKMAGSFGDVACFSFYPTKNLGAIGDGGAVVTSDDRIASDVRSLRQYGWERKYQNVMAGGRNSRLDEMQAAMLSSLLPDLDRRNDRRREIAAHMSANIRNPAIRCPAVLNQSYVAHLYVIRCDARSSLADHLAANGIATDIHYPIPDYRQPVLAGRYNGLHLPNTEAACAEVLTLPCFPELTDDEVEAVITACNGWSQE
jgi:dTDP-4-amino-4,6-dideoxygalactose transaminase